LQFAVCSLQFAVCSLQFAVCSLQFAVCSLQFAVCSLQFAVEDDVFGGRVRSTTFLGGWITDFWCPTSRF